MCGVCTLDALGTLPHRSSLLSNGMKYGILGILPRHFLEIEPEVLIFKTVH